MQVQVRTDDHIQGGESLAQWVQDEAVSRLARFKEYVTRLEVYLSDVDAGKSGAADKRAVLEARLTGRPALAASAEADKIADAFSAALVKLQHALDTEVGRLKDHGRASIRGQEVE